MALYIKLPDKGLVETVVNATTNEWDHSDEGFCQNSSASCHSARSKCHTSKTGEGDEYMLGCQSFMMRLRLIWSYYYCLASCFSVLYVGIYVWQNCIYVHMYNHRIHSTICWLHGYQPALLTTSANEQSVPSESYVQEVKEQLEETRKEHEIQESQHQRKTRSVSDGTGKIWTTCGQSCNNGNMMQPQLQV